MHVYESMYTIYILYMYTHVHKCIITYIRQTAVCRGTRGTARPLFFPCTPRTRGVGESLIYASGNPLITHAHPHPLINPSRTAAGTVTLTLTLLLLPLLIARVRHDLYCSYLYVRCVLQLVPISILYTLAAAALRGTPNVVRHVKCYRERKKSFPKKKIHRQRKN